MGMITYHKGPIGWAVSVDGRPVGTIKRIPSIRAYLVSVEGFRPGDGQSAPLRAGASGFTRGNGEHVFHSLSAAKAKVASVLCA